MPRAGALLFPDHRRVRRARIGLLHRRWCRTGGRANAATHRYRRFHRTIPAIDAGGAGGQDDAEFKSFGKCRKTYAKDNVKVCTNFNEQLSIFTGGPLHYITFDRRHYLNLKSFVRSNYRHIGKDDITGDEWQHNSIIYSFNVRIWPTQCGNTNVFVIELRTAK